MNQTKSKLRTTFRKNVLSQDVSNYLYNELSTIVPWHDGIRSKKGINGFTRKAYSISPNNHLYYELMPYIVDVLKQLSDRKYMIYGMYLNFYENGDMYTPAHSHEGTHQLVLSLGETRILKVNKKEYSMKNGDAILFGSFVHSVPKSETQKGRISIAT